MMRALETTALAIWVGTMAGFAFIFAPLAFGILTDLDQFAALTAATITRITYLGFACAACIALALAVQPTSRIRTIRACCLVVMIATSAYELWSVMPLMHHMLQQAGDAFTSLPRTDPQRVAYDAVHRRSSLVYGTTFCAGLIALVLGALDPTEARRLRQDA